jgi:penicillin-binding protein 1A
MGTHYTFRLSRRALWIMGSTAVAALVLGIASTVILSGYQRRAAAYDLGRIGEVREQSTIYDANGDKLGTFGSENRIVIPLAEVSPYFIDALLAREDRKFRRHDGVDVPGIFRAMVANLKAGKTRQGASTITQQLAKNAFALEGRTFDRKILEALLARRIEQRYSKDEILEFYVNRIYFGAGFHGIETASQGYFGKSAKELSVGEAAVLAGLIRSPSKLAPTKDAEAARRERDTVIDRMAETKVLTPQDATAAKATRVNVETSQKRMTRDSVTDAVLQELEQTLSPEVLAEGGLKVHITIDPQLQALAERAVDNNLTIFESRKGYAHPRKKEFVPAPPGSEQKKTDYLQGALVAIDNATGAIRAAAGGRDYSHSQFSRALFSKRQVGSTFKPFVFAAAFDRGLLPGTLVDDSRIEKGDLREISSNWSPENSDGQYEGPQPAAVGLLKSKNTMTVRVGESAGLPGIREIGRKTGMSDEIPNLPVVYLGAFESTLKDMTAAYTAFPNLGTMPTPHLISKVIDSNGNTLVQAPTIQRPVLEPGSAWMVSSILQEVMKSGTASQAAKLGWKKPAGGKTGTTNDFFDAWFIGYTSSLTCGVWVGFDTPKTIGEKAYGGTMALPIWVDFMKNVPEGKYATQPLPESPDLKEAKLCKVSGLMANPSCAEQGCAYEGTLPSASIPTKVCQTHAPTADRVAYEDTIPAEAPEPTPVAIASPVRNMPAAAVATSTLPPAGEAVPPASAALLSRTPVQATPATALPRPARPAPVVTESPTEESLPYRPSRPTTVRTSPVDSEVPTLVAEPQPAPPVRRAIAVETAPEQTPALAADDEEEENEGGWSLFKRPSKKTAKSNGTVYEKPAEPQAVPVRRAERVVRTTAPGELPAQPAPVPGDTAPVTPPIAEQTDAAPSDQPQRRVEKRGNTTITTTVIPVRKASAAKPEEKDDD